MAADEPTTSPQPRRLAPPEADHEPVPAAEPEPDRRDQQGAVPERPSGAIATLEAPPVPVIGVPDDPRTGEPRIPRTVVLASVLSFLSAANVVAGLLLIYWDAVPRDTFPHASWLMGQFVTEPGSAGRVLLAVAVTMIALLITVPLAITGYYAWAGYRWSRISGTIAAALSLGALTLNLTAWSAIPLAVVAAVLLWLPPASRYFLAWWARRHPQQVFAPPTVDVFYGPLPRYRQN